METSDANHAMDGNQAMTERIAIGFGSSSHALVQDVVSLIESCSIEMTPDSIVATLQSRSAIGEAVARTLNLNLMLFTAETLARVSGTVNYSSLASTKVGTPSVAEASALASLGPTARLILPRRTGRFCTCAVAVLP
jgi:cobalt-precorrin 5A hydrolase